MYEDELRKEILSELKNLITKVEQIEEDRDTYCEYMKTMILRTYSVN